MQPWELFNEIWTAKTVKVGEDLDFEIKTIDGQVTLILPGSTTLRDWINDFRATRKVYKDQDHKMKMHKGFIEVWKSGNDIVMEKLIEACEENNCIKPLITGHSMGGALSLFAAEDFKYRTGRSAEVVTFGAPKTCGDKTTAEYIKECCASITQYAIRNDIVPMLPPFPWYKHVNKCLMGDRFSFRQFIHFTENHCTYNQEEDYK